MNVLLITVRSDFGGGPRHVNQLISGFPPQINVFAAFPLEGDPYADQWKSILPQDRILGIPYRKFSFVTLLKMFFFCKRNHIDVVHSHGNGAGIYSRLLKLLGLKARIVHTFHGVTDNYSSKLKLLLNKLVGSFLKRFTDVFILVSQGELNLAEKMNFVVPSRSVVVFNGVKDPGCIANSEKFKVVTLSRFDYQKNMYMAYDIALKFKNSDVEFVWVGDGPDFLRLKEKAKKDNLEIEFVGFSDKPIDYLAASSLYLSTSRFEGLPYALIEAASLGLPIVASNVVGNNEVVFNEKNGFLFRSVDEACCYIQQFKDNPVLLKQMGGASRSLYEKLFSEEMIVKQIVSTYQSLIK
jgi:glycosyltransferase involved in cell wall biosynthesis